MPDVELSESRAVEVNVVGWVFTGIAIATVGLKLTARQMVKRLGWDDFFIFFSTVCSLPLLTSAGRAVDRLTD
jgi:hypothetical protein